MTDTGKYAEDSWRLCCVAVGWGERVSGERGDISPEEWYPEP
jgi:hypothetical protein